VVSLLLNYVRKEKWTAAGYCHGKWWTVVFHGGAWCRLLCLMICYDLTCYLCYCLLFLSSQQDLFIPSQSNLKSEPSLSSYISDKKSLSWNKYNYTDYTRSKYCKVILNTKYKYTSKAILLCYKNTSEMRQTVKSITYKCTSLYAEDIILVKSYTAYLFNLSQYT